jgi:hypothetical protein
MFSSQTTAHNLPKEHMNLEFVSTTGPIKMTFRGLIIAKNGDVAREENIEFFLRKCGTFLRASPVRP